MPMRKQDQKTLCRIWLEARLAEGPVRSDLLREEAMKEGRWSSSTLLRAAHELDVLSDSRAENFQRRTWWSTDNIGDSHEA
jgi:hypothetical protein